MKYRIRCGPGPAAKSRKARRRAGLEFGRQWQVVEDPPQAVLDDPHLECVALEEEEPAKKPPKKPEGDPPPAIPEDLGAVAYNDLKSLAAAHDLDVSGKKEDLLERLTAHREKLAAT